MNIFFKEQAELYKLHDRIQRLEEKVKEVHEKVEKLLTAIRNQDIIFKQRVEDVILDAVKKASAMQQLHLEHKLLFKMSELLDNKMRVHENRSENDLKSKCETHFLHLNAKLEDRLQERVELIKNVVNCKIVSQLKVEVKQLRSDLKNDQQMEFQRKMTKVMETCDKNKSDLKSQLEEDFKKVQDALLDHVKIEMKGLNDIIKNVESKLKINKRIFNDMRSEMSDVINNGLESRESKSDNCLDNDVVKEQPVIKQQLLKLRGEFHHSMLVTLP